MNKKSLTNVALRYRAVFLDIDRKDINMASEASVPVLAFVARLKENGFCVSEELLHALNAVPVDHLAEITECINDVMGVKLNWAPLVKGWDVPTGESLADHLITFIANIFGKKAGFKGTTLPCGHLIPEGTFPIERYNGCPFCGTPFKTADFVYKGQGSKLKELRLFTVDDMKHVLSSLLASATPLDATQKDSLKLLLRELPLPEDADITMKETAMLVIDLLVDEGKADEATKLLKTPTDVLRYLWFAKTGYVQIIEPKTLVAHARKLYSHMWGPLDRGANAAEEMKENLKLKYDRGECLIVARWLKGDIRVASGKVLYYENMGYERNYEEEQIISIDHGKVSGRKAFHNYTKDGFSFDQIGNTQIRSMHVSPKQLKEMFPLHLERYPELANAKRIVFSIRRAKVDETGHLVDCEIKVMKPTNNQQLAEEMEELMKAYHPWRVSFINGEYRAYGIERYTFACPLE